MEQYKRDVQRRAEKREEQRRETALVTARLKWLVAQQAAIGAHARFTKCSATTGRALCPGLRYMPRPAALGRAASTEGLRSPFPAAGDVEDVRQAVPIPEQADEASAAGCCGHAVTRQTRVRWQALRGLRVKCANRASSTQ